MIKIKKDQPPSKPFIKYKEKNVFASIFESKGESMIVLSRWVGVPSKNFRIYDLPNLIELLKQILEERRRIEQKCDAIVKNKEIENEGS